MLVKLVKLVKLVSLVFCLLVATVPAFAGTYLIFAQGQERSTDVWQGNAPVAGQNVAAGSVVKSWTIVDGDTYPANYKLVGNEIVHAVPVPDIPPVDPNTPNWSKFKGDIFQDNTINISARLEMAKLFPLLDAYQNQKSLLQQYWGALKAAALGGLPAYSWLDATAIGQIQAHATADHIPLEP